MRTPLLLIVTAAALPLGACHITATADTGPSVQRGFPVSGFTGIAVAGPYDVTVRTGAAPSVAANGSQKALDAMTVSVRDGTLEIGALKRTGFDWSFGNPGKVQVTVTVPALASANIAGSGMIDVDRVTGPNFKGQVAGSGDLKLGSVDAQAVDLSVAGSGKVAASGKALSAKYSIAGSGDIDARKLTTESSEVSISGSGDIKGNATRNATVTIMGSGDVEITGGAKCSISKNGSGDVRCS